MEIEITNTIQTQDFRLHLQAVLVERCRRNSSYSLRAFANSLEIDNSTLSQILRGRRKLTPNMKERLGIKLGMAPDEIQLFTTEVSGDNYSQISIDSFYMASEWYYFAILELMRTVDFKPQVDFVAKRLGITISEVNIAVERLERLEILKIHEDGRWEELTNNNMTTIGDNFTSIAHQRLQQSYLKIASEAIEDVSFEKRSNTGMTMAIKKDKLPEVTKIITEFRRKISAFLEDASELDEVYQLSIALFPLTKLGDNHENNQ